MDRYLSQHRILKTLSGKSILKKYNTPGDYRFDKGARNIGWRLDYYLVSDHFLNNVKDKIIHEEIKAHLYVQFHL